MKTPQQQFRALMVVRKAVTNAGGGFAQVVATLQALNCSQQQIRAVVCSTWTDQTTAYLLSCWLANDPGQQHRG